MTRLTALVLAGQRDGADALAAAEGASHKALLPVGGRAMVERVVAALDAVGPIGRIVIAIERPALLDALPGLWPPERRCATSVRVADRGGPSASVAAALADEGTPLLVTTADHALLQPAWVEAFLAACPPGADLAVALAPRAVVEAAVPATRRTWLRFADGDHAGCNLFLLAGPRAAGVIELWRTLEQDRKHPLRLMRRLGWRYALRYRLGRLTLAAAAARLGALAGGARIAFVMVQDGRAAIDVDTAGDLALVRRLAGIRMP